MKNRIIEIIIEVGLNPDIFIIGDGADSINSIIHYNPNRSYVDSRKVYSVQFCEDIVAIWEIGKRIKSGASIDLNWGGIRWKEINEPRVKNISVKNQQYKFRII